MTILNDVTVRNGARFFTATVDGVRYEIPEMWSIGYCTTHGGNAIDAAQAWHEQALMEAEFKAQQKTIQVGSREYRVEKTQHGYILTGKRGAVYGLMRNRNNPHMLFAYDLRGNCPRALDIGWFSDITGELVVNA